jgi:hypothetical protein
VHLNELRRQDLLEINVPIVLSFNTEMNEIASLLPFLDFVRNPEVAIVHPNKMSMSKSKALFSGSKEVIDGNEKRLNIAPKSQGI